jgi:hypothetical protein
MLDQSTYFNYTESRAQSGYGSAILVKRPGKTKFSLLVPSTTVPYVFGSYESFEFDLLNSPTKGKVKGKLSLEDKDVSVLHHRDTVYIFEELKDKTLDFLVINQEYVGYRFTATVSYKPNDAEAGTNMGTYTITPISASTTPIMNARHLCEPNIFFKSSIPESIELGTTDTETISVEFYPSSVAVSCTFKKYNETTEKWETSTRDDLTYSDGKINVTATASGLYAITAGANGYAEWTTTIYIGRPSST